ncbi:TPA: hypothetical protein ENX78_17850 [Candidatus Poribacteria bacterium]|nr:hypothetical protein [Candidatus Poribacteria bacterium]
MVDLREVGASLQYADFTRASEALRPRPCLIGDLIDSTYYIRYTTLLLPSRSFRYATDGSSLVMRVGNIESNLLKTMEMARLNIGREKLNGNVFDLKISELEGRLGLVLLRNGDYYCRKEDLLNEYLLTEQKRLIKLMQEIGRASRNPFYNPKFVEYVSRFENQPFSLSVLSRLNQSSSSNGRIFPRPSSPSENRRNYIEMSVPRGDR